MRKVPSLDGYLSVFSQVLLFISFLDGNDMMASQSLSFSHGIFSEECSHRSFRPRKDNWYSRIWWPRRKFPNDCSCSDRDSSSELSAKGKPKSLYSTYSTTIAVHSPSEAKTIVGDLPLRKLRRTLNSEMEHLSITGRRLDRRFAKRFRRTSMDSLTRLTLSGNQLYRDPRCARKLMKHLPENLELLNLSWNGLNSTDVKHLANRLKKLDKLQWIGLCGNPIHADGLSCLLEGRNICALAKTVDLWDCEIADTGAFRLGIALAEADCRVEKLVLDMNCIGNEGIKGLSLGLAKNSSLRSLELYCNDIDHEGLEALMEALKTSKVERLNLRANRIGPIGAEVLAKELKDTCLKSIHLGHNSIGDEGAAHIAAALQGTPELPCQLEELSLSFNRLSNKSIRLLGKALTHNKCLKVLNLEGNRHVDRRGASVFVQALEVNKVLTNLSLLERSYDNHLVNDKLDLYTRSNHHGRQHWGNMESIPPGAWAKILESMSQRPNVLFRLLQGRPDILGQRR